MKTAILEKYPHYIIYEDGKVFSLKSNKFLIPQDNGNGYLKVTLSKFQVYIHRLVAEAFIHNPENLLYVDHINRNKQDNRVENLKWSTAKENTKNTAGLPRYGVSKKKARHHKKELIEQIKEDYKNGLKVMELSKKYNIPRQSISRFIKD